MLDLEECLRAADSSALGLEGWLERVRVSAERIWAVPRLAFFTDHSATRHSRRIVQLLGGLAEELQSGPQALSRSELYVLLASAYLHDIGMQDFSVDGRGQEEFGLSDYEVVRRRHPERARHLIVERALSLVPGRDLFRIDIDDELQYLLPIALVSQGHGSSYFETSVAALREADYAPENIPLRGALLTALLLYADELDLHEDRASFPLEMAQSPLTALHHHLNHYVTRVTVRPGATSHQRRVELSMSFPQGSEDYQGDVRLYVTSKLASQATRINPVLRSETDGYLEVEPTVRVRSHTETIEGARRELPVEALNRLRCELLEDQLVDRDGLVAALTGAIQARRLLVVELTLEPESDVAPVLSWLEALAASACVMFTHLDLELSVATETSDLVAALSESAEPAPTFVDSASLAGVAHDVTGFAIWVLEGVDRLLPDTLEWLRNELQPFVGTDLPVLVVLSRTAESPRIVDGATEYRLGKLTEEALERHLIRRFGDDAAEASRRAHEAHLLSGGSPIRTLSALSARLNRAWTSND